MNIETLFETETSDNTIVLTPVRDMGEFEMAVYDMPVFEYLKELVAEKNVIIDFSKTDYFGSSTIGMFIRLVQHIRDFGRHIVFCNLSTHEEELLKITHILSLWTVVDSLEDAQRNIDAVAPSAATT